jgi:hypothetical protein
MIARRVGIRFNERVGLAKLNSESSNPAKLYLPSLKRLLLVTDDFDVLTRTFKDLNQTAWIRALIRTKLVLTEEEERLRLIDRSIRSVLDCLGGDGHLLIEPQYTCQNQAGDRDSNEAVSVFGQQLVLNMLSKWYLFKMDPPPFDLSDEDKSAIRFYFENQTDQGSRAQGSEESRQHARFWTVNRSAPSIPVY